MSDKRSVATDALEVLGKVIPADMEVGRDAVHLATITVTSDLALAPGQRVGIVGGKAVNTNEPLGIVDPFLTRIVLPGEKFLVLIMPRTIASLRHVWSHPSIPDEAPVVTEKIVEVVKAESDFDRLMRMLDEFGRNLYDHPLSGGQLFGYMCSDSDYEYHTVYGSDAHGRINIPEECFDLYEKIYSKRSKIDPRDGGELYFSCSC